MAGVASGRLGDSRPYDGVLTRQESSEWRTSEQLENGTPSTSSFWDTDDDGCGQRPSELYGSTPGKFHKFSKINKRELRSDAFEVGVYKWYILMYPQGCDVCNHLSLFLCVANHDKLLPGWSHFAQFTIAVVNNKDIKKSKHSDTLHRFCKKEHDWGWKKFIELSKVVDGFIDTDTLTIEAEVQVIRERADRPFRCLTCKYRRELVCVYLSNVEQICHQFVEERRSKLGNFLEDKARWSSFCAFWLRIDQKTRRSLTREKTDSVLRVIVKHFFVEKEVTSTLVMDSLFSGLKTLEGQIKTNKGWRKLMGTDKLPVPVVRVEQEMFVVVDDVLLLLERAALDPLPSTDNKGPQKPYGGALCESNDDGSSGDDSSKGSIVSDERRLTELGRRTIEIFVLSHIFSKIEVAYQEAVALKRQEELIREEAAWLETEQKSKRGAAEKEKKSKKKLGKQKRNNRKGKDKGRDDYAIDNAMDKFDLESLGEGKDSMGEQAKPELVEPETFEDVSDVSDTIDRVTEVVHPDSEERESSPVNWDTDTFKVGGVTSALSSVQNGIRETNGLCTVVDDSSSTCSTDSVPSVVMNESLGSSSRKWKQRGRATSDMFGWVNEGSIRSSNARSDVAPLNGSYGSRKTESEPDPATESLLDQIKKRNQHVVKGQVAFHRTEPSIKHQADTQRPPKEKTSSSSPISSFKSTTLPILPKLEAKITAPSTNISIKRPLSDIPQLAPHVRNSADMAVSARFEPRKPLSPPKPTIRSLTQEVPVMPRPLSAPIVPGPRPSTPVVSMVQSKPLISRSVSAVGRLGLDPTLVSHLHQSNSNVTMGTNIFTPSTSTSSAYAQPQSPSIAFNLLQHYPTPANVICPPMFGVVNRPSMQNDSHAPDLYKQVHSRSLYSLPTGSQACKSGRQTHSVLTDEFPHLDIINDLLDDEYGTADIYAERKTSVSPHFHRQFSYHGDIGMTNDMLVGPSTSPCRFGQSHSSHEPVFQPSYTRDFFTQQNLRPPPNGQTQWQVAGSDSSYLNTMTLEGGGNPYYNPDYPNLAVNSNGYTVFRPSNGQ